MDKQKLRRNTYIVFLLPFLLACGIQSQLLPAAIPASKTPQEAPEAFSSPTATVSTVTITADVLTVRPCPADDDIQCPPLRYLLRGEEIRWFARTWNGWLRIGDKQYIYEKWTD
jgi:hypothetical protein